MKNQMIHFEIQQLEFLNSLGYDIYLKKDDLFSSANDETITDI